MVATSLGRRWDALTIFVPTVLIAISYAFLGLLLLFWSWALGELCSQDQRRGRVWGTRFNFITCSATVCMFFMYIMTKINFCYHAMVQAIWFSIVWLIDNSSSRTCLNIAQCTIGIGLRFYILVWSVSGAFFFFVQFYSFRTISHWLLKTLFVFVCLFVSLCFVVTNQFH